VLSHMGKAPQQRITLGLDLGRAGMFSPRFPGFLMGSFVGISGDVVLQELNICGLGHAFPGREKRNRLANLSGASANTTCETKRLEPNETLQSRRNLAQSWHRSFVSCHRRRVSVLLVWACTVLPDTNFEPTW
jgi:hypothetical protein